MSRITGLELETAATLPEAFARVIAARPNAIAVADDGRALTYAELDAASDELGAALAAHGAGRGERVGILLERSREVAVAVLAILKTGAAYVPLDLTNPPERLRTIAEDAGLRLVVGSAADVERAGLARFVEPVAPDATATGARPPLAALGRADLAYVIYTSGSTGAPKGVAVTHGNVLALLFAALPLFDLTPDDRWTLFHSHSFDFAVWELWGALLTSARAVVVPLEAARAPDELLALLRRERITVLNQVPSVFRYLALAHDDAGRPPLDLRYVIFGGESVALDVVRGFAEACVGPPPVFVNMYGITEITVHATWKVLTRDVLAGPVRSPIGRPLPHLSIEVLDEHGRRVPPGEVGEMWISGAGVAAGYVNRPELTAERFVARGGDPAARAYRTGDLARSLPDGELEFAGRNDDQVKLRGFRIELGEIEAVLRRHPGVRDVAAAVARDGSGEPALVAFVVADGAARDDLVPHLRRHALAFLPPYMAPERYALVQALPLTESGKLDRQRLLRTAAA